MREECGHTSSAIAADEERRSSDGISAEDIHKQLDRILQSNHLRGSLRLACFLKFVVETTLAGKAETIKAYTIAVDALGRGQDFDPQRDPIVRVEAGRLRMALARYYAEKGRDDPLFLELPRGTYVPVVRRREAVWPAPQGPSVREIALPVGFVARYELFAAMYRESELLRRAVSQQSTDLAAELKAVQEALADSCALLRQPLPSIANFRAPPLSPHPSPLSVDEAPAECEAVAINERKADLLPQQPSALAASVPPLSHRLAVRFPPLKRASLIVICTVAALAALGGLFDIDRLLTGGQNHGLFFKVLAAEYPHTR